MTEVVTSGAAFSQPFLQALKPQALGISNPDSPQVALQITAEALRERATVAAAEVPRASDERSSLQDNATPRNDQQAPRARAPEPQAAPAAPTGPSKARVELPPIQLAEPAPAAPAPTAPVVVQQSAPAPAAPQPAPAAEASAPVEAPAVSTGPLGPAAQLNTLALEAISQNIIGVAFAPTQVVAQTGAVETPSPQGQKNFIFAQRKLFADVEHASGRFAAEERRVQVVETVQTQKFVEVAQPVVNTVASAKFAATETAQKLSDKVPVEQKIVESGEVRLYDKVAQTETQNRFARDEGRGDSRRHFTRESLFQRAQQVASAYANKGENAEVKKVFADIQAQKAGAVPAAVVSPSVILTA